MTPCQIARHLRAANDVARRALAAGHHPFGAVLVAPDGETVIAEQGNVDSVNHAESVLARGAAARHAPEFLWNCTLVTTFEPCAMCAATQYWAHVGGLVYGASEARLLQLTGSDPQNPTLDLPCREVFARGQKAMRVWGPVAELEAELVEPHRSFWRRGVAVADGAAATDAGAAEARAVDGGNAVRSEVEQSESGSAGAAPAPPV